MSQQVTVAFEIVHEYPFTQMMAIEGDSVMFCVEKGHAFDVMAVEDQLERQGLSFELSEREQERNIYEASVEETERP